MNSSKPLMAAALVAFAFLGTVPAQVGYLTGQELLQTCVPATIDPVYRLKVAECRGYVVGIADSSDCSKKNLEFRWNSSTTASQFDLVNIVVDWLRGHPALLQYQADGLVAAALAESFPCKSVTASGSN